MADADEINATRESIAGMRARVNNVRHAEVEALLDRLFIRRTGGKHPYVWTSMRRPREFPIVVPRHGSKPVKSGTLRMILGQAEAELDAWEAELKD